VLRGSLADELSQSGRRGPADEEALREIDAELPQERKRRAVLDPLCDRLQSEATTPPWRSAAARNVAGPTIAPSWECIRSSSSSMSVASVGQVDDRLGVDQDPPGRERLLDAVDEVQRPQFLPDTGLPCSLFGDVRKHSHRTQLCPFSSYNGFAVVLI
jgi:hypothetical protein